MKHRHAPPALLALLGLGAVVAPASAAAQAAATGDPSLGEAHSVESGDTLWDLCEKYLNSPWYWPKIWSYNPQLTNPHWIYPGNEIRFYPGDEQLPTEVAVDTSLAEAGEDLTIPGQLTDDEMVRTVGTIETGRGARGSVFTTRVGYVSRAAMEQSGRVVNSSSESVLLSDYDRLYIEGQGIEQGARLAVYRATREIVHPITGESYGFAIEIVGAVDIVEVGDAVATGRVARAYASIGRGDRVGPFPDGFTRRVRRVPNQATVKGYVLETVGAVLGPVGEHHLVYVDRGRNHGVQRGNTFVVYQRGDRYTFETRGLPLEPIATLMVLDVQAEASTAIVTASVHEFGVGDKVEMSPE